MLRSHLKPFRNRPSLFIPLLLVPHPPPLLLQAKSAVTGDAAPSQEEKATTKPEDQDTTAPAAVAGAQHEAMPGPSTSLGGDSRCVGDTTGATLVGTASDAALGHAPAAAEVSDEGSAAQPAAVQNEPQLLPPPPLDVATPSEMETVVRLFCNAVQVNLNTRAHT